MKRCLFITLLFCFTQLYAINGNDTIEKKLRTIKNDSTKLDYLCDVCVQFINTDKPKAKQYCQLMIDISKNCKNDFKNANAYRLAGIYYQEIQDYQNSLNYYNKAINIIAKIHNANGKILYAKTLESFGTLYHSNGDFESALKLYLKADSIFSEYHEVNALIIL